MEWHQTALLAACSFAAWQDGLFDAPRSAAWDLAAWNRPLLRCAAVIIANAAILTIMFMATGHNYPEVAMLVDAVSAWIVMRHPASHPQGWIGLTFGAQIGCHLGTIFLLIRGLPLNLVEPSYFDSLKFILMIQLAMLVTWGESSGGRVAYLLRRLVRTASRRVAINKIDAR